MLKIDNLTFKYPGRNNATINDLSLTVPEGGVYGLLGRNGVGKSTLLYLIAGLLTPASGCVEFDGAVTRKRDPHTMASMFIVPEELTLPDLTLRDYVAVNAPFYPNFSHNDLRRHLTTFEIDPDLPYKLTSLSMGQRKKVFMSFALACNTPLVLMDEPTNGLDIPGKMAFRRFIASSVHTTDPAVAERALYAQPSVGGISAVLLNDGSYETEINLECLFELASTRPDVLAQLFKK